MTNTEKKNFYRKSILVVDHTNEALTGLLEHDLTKQGLTLLQLLQAKHHEIYHLYYNSTPCCMCPPGSPTPVFQPIHRITNPTQLGILLDTAAKLPGHNKNSLTKHCCCPANHNINYDILDLTLTRCLLVNFTTTIPAGSPERMAVDELIKFRNESYDAAKGEISDYDYQICKAQIEKFIMVLAKVQGRESEFQKKLSDAAIRPLDETILRQYQTTLMESVKIMQTMKQLSAEKTLPEYFTKSLDTQSCIEGENVHFECVVLDDNQTSLWFKDGAEVNTSAKYNVERQGTIHKLVVNETQLDDQGEYTVKIKNCVRRANLIVREYFTKALDTKNCIEGENVQFECRVLDNNQMALWFKDGTELIESDRYQVERRGRLHRLVVNKIKLNDEGEYSVKIKNCVRQSELIVREYFTKSLDTQTCVEGENAQFECRVLNDNQWAMWFKGCTELITSDKYKVERQGKLHRLVVNGIQLNDKGKYSVEIRNCIRRTKLKVLEYFTKALDTQTCIEGDDVQFECRVIDDNQKALWLKDGTEVITSDKCKVQSYGRLHRLVLNRTKLDDKGEYSVKIKNCVRRAQLRVREYFTKSLDRQTCVEGENVHFECRVLDENETALWFKDGIKVITSDKYKVERNGRLHRLIVNRTKIDDKGEYSVKIKNCVRWAKLSVQVIPKAIKNLSLEDKELYKEIINSGTEVRNYIRIVIIGENGVGKTCLLRRLLRQSTTGVLSTDGVDIHRCTINMSNDQWIVNEVSDKKNTLLLRLKKAKDLRTEMKNSFLENYPQSSCLFITDFQDDDIDIIQSSIRKSIDSSHSSSGRIKMTWDDQLINKFVEIELKDKMLTSMQKTTSYRVEVEMKSTSQLHKTFTTKLLNKEVSQALDDFLNGIEGVDISSDVLVECELLDFAGEKKYYATHPIFLNPNAIHLVVANIMKDVEPIKTEDGFDKIGEYIDFWLDSIHCCGVNEELKEEPNTEFLQPPVILVCTRIDECRDHIEERKQLFCKQLGGVLKNETKKKHIRELCYVSNIESDEEDFCGLRSTILKYGKQLETFAEELPLKWIRLEHLLDVFREAGVNILSWPDLVKLSLKCSIDSENEINLFIKYQHKVGNVIYFESIKEFIILNQKWLANAFRCLVSVKFDSNLMLSDEWRALEDTGKLEHALIEKLFDKEPELDFSIHSGHILNVMEIFGIIVKLMILLEDGKKKILQTYYMPCMIAEKASFTDVIDLFNAKKGNCKRTPWLCIEFDFMPFDFFNHILCYYINQYPMCTEPQTGRMAIYHGIAVFFLDNSKFIKFILCFCKNAIALQIWQWRNMERGTCKAMLSELKVTADRLKHRFETRNVSYTVKSKCPDGNVQISAGRHSCSELVHFGEEYFCEEHIDSHNTQEFFQTWFEDYTENENDAQEQMKLKGIKGDLESEWLRCHVCRRKPYFYKCRRCEKKMCADCKNQHWESIFTEWNIVQHTKEMDSWEHIFRINVQRIHDIKVLHDDVLVISDGLGGQLVTCHITGQQQHFIPIPGLPRFIAVVDINTVAVTLVTTVVIVDLRQRQVIQDVELMVGCYGIMCKDNQLFVGCDDRTIKVMNMLGEVTHAIPVAVIPGYICDGKGGQIYYTYWDTLYCIDNVGNTLFKLIEPNIKTPWALATDDEGHVLFTTTGGDCVVRIWPDGKQGQIIYSERFRGSPYICYNSLSESVVIGAKNTVYVFKYKR